MRHTNHFKTDYFVAGALPVLSLTCNVVFDTHWKNANAVNALCRTCCTQMVGLLAKKLIVLHHPETLTCA